MIEGFKEKQTKAIRNQLPRTNQSEHSVPIFLTSSFTFPNADEMRAAFADENDDNIYSRYSNPSVDEFSAKMAALEGAEAGWSTASGMAAIAAPMFALLKAGDHIISSSSIFGGTTTVITKFLSKFGVEHTMVSATDVDSWEDAVKPNSKMVFIETPTNPQLEILDLEKVGKFCKKHNLIYFVDNCFATPVLQNPIEYGADLVTHSATKWIDGQGRVLGGCVVGKKDLIHEIYLFCRNFGTTLSPFNAWVLSKSLETLEVRMERHCDNALKLAQYLEKNLHVAKVIYPGLPSHPQYEIAKKQMRAGGGIVTFEAKGGLEAGRVFMDSLKMLSLTPNLGDVRSIASHPASTTHAKVPDDVKKATGITPGLIRISVGLESIDDIIGDIEQALNQTTN